MLLWITRLYNFYTLHISTSTWTNDLNICSLFRSNKMKDELVSFKAMSKKNQHCIDRYLFKIENDLPHLDTSIVCQRIIVANSNWTDGWRLEHTLFVFEANIKGRKR